MKDLVIHAICITLFISVTTATHWKDCGSKESKIASVAVGGCETANVCPLYQGTNATVTVKFHNNKAFTGAKSIVHGILAGIPVPFPIPQSDACQDSGLTCPVAASTDNTYTTKIYVKKVYPKVKVVVKWEMQDQDKNNIFCMELPAEVEANPKHNVKHVNQIP